MKNSLCRLLLVALVSAAGATLAPTTSQAVNLMLNFSLGNPTTNVPSNARTISGYDNVCAPFVGTAVNASITNIDGTGYNFTFNNVSSYDTGMNAEPLTTSGFYTFNNDGSDHTFTLSGLPLGATVTLYAVSAWDGNGRAAFLVFGGSTTQALVVGDPGTTPTLANFTQINAVPLVVGLSGSVSGTMSGSGGVGSGTEGQVGGFIFAISAPAAGGVPEPSTFALGAVSAAGLAGWLLRRRKLAA